MPKPKKVTTYRTCPECGDRGTKLLHLSSDDPDKPYQCQGSLLPKPGAFAGTHALVMPGGLHEC